MKRIFLFLLTVALMCGLGLSVSSCKSDDDDTNTPAKPAPWVQVTTVFAPGQLGDMGYADRVMKGVSKLLNDETDNVEVDIITADSVWITRKMLKDWAATKTSAVDGADYSRRLLVLTEPYMVDWLAEAKAQLTATDEVLLLKANEADVTAAAQTLGMSGRVYGLNISAASAVRHFNAARLQYYAWKNVAPDAMDIPVLRLHNTNVVAYRDSISETLTELSATHKAPDTWGLIDQPGESYSPAYKVTAFEAAYDVCAEFYQQVKKVEEENGTEGVTKLFAISDLGSANHGAELFLVGMNQDVRVVMLMLDDESTIDMMRFSVIRHFDRAIDNWLQQWLVQPAGSMPVMEKHGGWDGYCTDDVDVNLLKMI